MERTYQTILSLLPILLLLSGCLGGATPKAPGLLQESFYFNICDHEHFEGECIWSVDGVACATDASARSCDGREGKRELTIQNVHFALAPDVREAIEFGDVGVSLRFVNVSVHGGALLRLSDIVCDHCHIILENVDLDGDGRTGSDPIELVPPQYEPRNFDLELHNVTVSNYSETFRVTTAGSVLMRDVTLQDSRRGIEVNHASSVDAQRVSVRNATDTWFGAISLYNAGDVRLQDVHVQDSMQGVAIITHDDSDSIMIHNLTAIGNGQYGLRTGWGTIHVSDSTFIGNGHTKPYLARCAPAGICLGSHAVTIRGSIFEENADFGAYSASLVGFPDARENWWGDPRGPSPGTGYEQYDLAVAVPVAGQPVSAHIEYHPWLTSRPAR